MTWGRVTLEPRTRRPSTKLMLTLLVGSEGATGARFSQAALAHLEGLTAVRPITGNMLSGESDNDGQVAFELNPEGLKVGKSGSFSARQTYAAAGSPAATVRYSLEPVSEPFVGFIGTIIVKAAEEEAAA